MPLDPTVLSLLRRCEELAERGQPATLEEVCRDLPEVLDELRRERSIRHDTPTQPEPHRPPAPPAESTFRAQRYQALRFHARGGLGEVWRARDEELRREVALKRIRPGQADHPEGRRRFLLEAEVTARLGHPGVVPVYGLVHDDNGRPAYAMRFIEGETLQDAVERFHAADRLLDRDPGERSLALRELLGRFSAVCHTVAFAHSKGVLHRDLKPSNVMLGRYGETLVVDWGIAKLIDDKSDPKSDEANSEEVGTQAGQVLGTPAYMSPEQAAGQVEAMGPASDVYSLGATLYHLLTGSLPFSGSSREVCAQVQRGDFPPPRAVKPNVPRPLEAVCLKAMALRPEDRYASALELADDLQRWLADEPVRAWREPWSLRLRRWLRRRRVQVVAAAALIVLLVLAVFNVQLARARDLAERQRERSEELFRLLSTGMEQVYTEAVDDAAARASGQEGLRGKLLETGLRVYTALATDLAGEAGRERETAAARFLVARIKNDLGHDDALAAYAAVLEEHRRLEAESPDDVGLRTRLAGLYRAFGQSCRQQKDPRAVELLEEAYRRYGELADGGDPEARPAQGRVCATLAQFFEEQGRIDEALDAHRRAHAVRSELVRQDGSARARRDLAQTCNSLGVLFEVKRNEPARAVEWYQQAIALRQGLVDEAPADAAQRSELARTWYNLGNARRSLAQTAAAADAYERARPMLAHLVRTDRTTREQRRRLGFSCLNLSVARRERGDWAGAVQAAIEAVDAFEALAEGDPGRETTIDLARALNNLAEWQRDRGDWDEARRTHERTLALRRDLAAAPRATATDRYHLADSLHNLGQLEYNAGRLGRARALLEESERALEIISKENPQNRNYSRSLARTRATLSLVLLALGRPEEARSKGDQSLANRGPAAQRGDTNDRRALMQSWHAQGLILLALDRPAEAAALLTQARATAEELARRDPGRVDFRTDLALVLPDLGLALAAAGRLDESRAACRDAERARNEALTAFPGVAAYRRFLRQHDDRLAQLQRALSQSADAAATLRRRKRLWPDRPEELTASARGLAQCAARATDAVERDRYAGEAVMWFVEAVVRGDLGAAAFLRSSEGETLRRHPDSPLLRRALEARARETAEEIVLP